MKAGDIICFEFFDGVDTCIVTYIDEEDDALEIFVVGSCCRYKCSLSEVIAEGRIEHTNKHISSVI